MNQLRPCLVVTGALLAICCVVYPAIVTGASRVAFPNQASGSLIERDGKVIGSSLIGQSFDKPEEHPEYFWSRPSAASVDSATGILYSSGSNYGPLNASLEDEVKSRVASLRAAGATGPIPVDLVTKSASGIDPHVSPAAAEVQLARVAKARNASESDVRALVEKHTEGRTLGFLGEPRVNVLDVNLDLDQRWGKKLRRRN
jgi:K+-transporting ATPase ATPase C chain